jgi:hypothetical protein
MDALPGARPAAAPPTLVAVPAEILERYVGEYKAAAGAILTFRRDGTRLMMKLNANPEVPVYARAETRFFFGPTVIEFQLDSAGTVTGLILEQGTQRTLASRTR